MSEVAVSKYFKKPNTIAMTISFLLALPLTAVLLLHPAMMLDAE